MRIYAAALHATLPKSPERASTSAHRCSRAGIRVSSEDAVGLRAQETDSGRSSCGSHLASWQPAASSRPVMRGLLRQNGCISLVETPWNSHEDSRKYSGPRYTQAPESGLAERNNVSNTPSTAL